jgi:hypothetical protein
LREIEKHIQNEFNLTVEENTPSLIFNISSIGELISSAHHNNPSVIRTSSISSTYKILSLTFYKKKSGQQVKIFIKGANSKLKITIQFKQGITAMESPSPPIESKLVGERKLQSFSISLIKETEHPIPIKYSTKEHYVEQKKKFFQHNHFKKHFESKISKQKESLNSFGGRKLLIDKFGASLIHVNHLLNSEFGRISRKVPAQ